MEIKIVKGTVNKYKEKLESLNNASQEVKDLHNNTIYFIYEVDEQGNIISQSGRIYIGSIEFSRPTECLTDLSFIVGNNNVDAIKKKEI